MSNNFVVFGNPIQHSLSPRIYEIFSKKKNINYKYGKILSSLNNFENYVLCFFNNNGIGANITAPFKKYAFLLCKQLTKRSYISGVVNTIKKKSDRILLGDNTDGIGLIYDLQRLNFLCKKKSNSILIIGSGGAARGIIPFLLMYGCKVTITNRTFTKAKELANIYSHIGNIKAQPLDLLKKINYNLVINATSAGMNKRSFDLPNHIITPEIFCYDLFYQKNCTPFIKWCCSNGACYYSDGLGMLVSQAAYSFLLWHKTLPLIDPVIEKLRFELNH